MAICIITFRRPVGLERLLTHLAQQTLAEPKPDVRVIVVENEAEGPGREVCDRMRADFPFPLEYVVEARRGIPFARNKAVVCAGKADWIAFIDDDEWPCTSWLNDLLTQQTETGADVVAGPVLPVYEEDVPHWVIRGGFHNRKRWPSGNAIVPMGTGNVLIRRTILESLSPPFDQRFALFGGSDSHFFQRASRAGYSAVWCDEAVVEESVPASRATASWICQRAYRSGANFARTQFEVQPWFRACRNVGWRVLKHFGWGVVGLPRTLWQGKAGFVDQLSHLSRAGGILAGLCGFQYAEYQTIHGQ